MSEVAPMLLDTCAVIWLAGDLPIGAECAAAIANARIERMPIYVSPITAWEIGMLVAGGRMTMQMAPDRWFAKLLDAPGLQLTDMPPSVLIAASFLPGDFHSDPADRILAATAREFGYRLVTRDRPLLRYAAQGHLKVLAC